MQRFSEKHCWSLLLFIYIYKKKICLKMCDKRFMAETEVTSVKTLK